MNVETIYKELGLQNPKQFERDIKTNSLFLDDFETQKSILEGGRRTGKTTRAIISAISNIFKEKSTIIICNNYYDCRRHSDIFLNFAKKIFPNFSEKQNSMIFQYRKTNIIFAEEKDNVLFVNGLPLTHLSTNDAVTIDDTI
jgi:type I site-specific restriction-modification system R (restriction) subunit